MALYRLDVKPIRRSQGGNACAAAAYRTGTHITEFDYSRRRGVADRALFLPPNAPAWDRAQLWEEAEKAERRKNSVVAREVLLALPHEMPLDGHRKAVGAFCGWLVGRYGVAADAALHTPRSGHDARNIHAHVLMTTRRLTAQGLTEKTRELDDLVGQGPREIEAMREQWAKILKGFGFDLEHKREERGPHVESRAPCYPVRSSGSHPVPPFDRSTILPPPQARYPVSNILG